MFVQKTVAVISWAPMLCTVLLYGGNTSVCKQAIRLLNQSNTIILG